MNKLTKTVKESEASYEFIRSLNGIVGLTERELEVFSGMIDIKMSDIRSRKQRLPIDRKDSRKSLIEKFGISKENLSRYVRKYKNRGLLIKNKFGSTDIMPALIPVRIGGRAIQATIILKIKEEIENDLQTD